MAAELQEQGSPWVIRDVLEETGAHEVLKRWNLLLPSRSAGCGCRAFSPSTVAKSNPRASRRMRLRVQAEEASDLVKFAMLANGGRFDGSSHGGRRGVALKGGSPAFFGASTLLAHFALVRKESWAWSRAGWHGGAHGADNLGVKVAYLSMSGALGVCKRLRIARGLEGRARLLHVGSAVAHSLALSSLEEEGFALCRNVDQLVR